MAIRIFNTEGDFLAGKLQFSGKMYPALGELMNENGVNKCAAITGYPAENLRDAVDYINNSSLGLKKEIKDQKTKELIEKLTDVPIGKVFESSLKKLKGPLQRYLFNYLDFSSFKKYISTSKEIRGQTQNFRPIALSDYPLKYSRKSQIHVNGFIISVTPDMKALYNIFGDRGMALANEASFKILELKPLVSGDFHEFSPYFEKIGKRIMYPEYSNTLTRLTIFAGALPSTSLIKLKGLESLTIYFHPRDKIPQFYPGIQFPNKLKKLSIIFYGETKGPNFFSNTSFPPNLQRLEILGGTGNFENIVFPESLRHFEIYGPLLKSGNLPSGIVSLKAFTFSETNFRKYPQLRSLVYHGDNPGKLFPEIELPDNLKTFEFSFRPMNKGDLYKKNKHWENIQTNEAFFRSLPGDLNHLIFNGLIFPFTQNYETIQKDIGVGILIPKQSDEIEAFNNLLKFLPRGLRKLTFKNSGYGEHYTLGELPNYIEELTLDGFVDIEKFPEKLKKLNCGIFFVGDLNGRLPDTVEEIKLYETSHVLTQLPSGLKRITLKNPEKIQVKFPWFDII